MSDNNQNRYGATRTASDLAPSKTGSRAGRNHAGEGRASGPAAGSAAGSASATVSLRIEDFFPNKRHVLSARDIARDFPHREPKAFQALRRPRIVDGAFLIRECSMDSGDAGWRLRGGMLRIAALGWSTPSSEAPDCAASLDVALRRDTDIFESGGCPDTWWLDFHVEGLGWDHCVAGSLELLNAIVARCLTNAANAAFWVAQDAKLSVQLGIHLHGILDGAIETSSEVEISCRDIAMKTVEATLLAKISGILECIDGGGPIRRIILSNDIRG